MTTFFLTALLIAVKLNLRDAPRAQDNLSKLLAALSAITAPTTGTLQNLCTFLVRVPVLGTVMVESVLRLMLATRKERSERGECSLAAFVALLTRGEDLAAVLLTRSKNCYFQVHYNYTFLFVYNI